MDIVTGLLDLILRNVKENIRKWNQLVQCEDYSRCLRTKIKYYSIILNGSVLLQVYDYIGNVKAKTKAKEKGKELLLDTTRLTVLEVLCDSVLIR